MNPKDSQQSWLLDLRQELLGALLRGAITPNASRRKNAHSREYTKRYADGRQKRGGRLWRAEQLRLGRAIPRQLPVSSQKSATMGPENAIERWPK